MASPVLSPVQQQIQRVRRRLFLQTLLDSLIWCWAAALVLAAGWFLVQPYLLNHGEDWLRWTVAGGLVAVFSVLAIILARWRQPAPLDVALAVDAKFGLKERVTTSYTLSPEQVQTPAGQALLADVNQRVAPLDVASQFPLRLSWSAVLVPVCAAVLAVVAFFYEPVPGSAVGGTGEERELTLAEAKELQQKLNNLKKTPTSWPKEQPRSKELKEIEADWNKLIEQPLDLNDKEQVRERMHALRTLEEKMKDRANDLKTLAEKNQNLKQQMKKLAALDAQGEKLTKDGPAKDLQDALAKGEINKAQEEVERLRKKMEDNQLSKQELKELQDQMEDLRKQVKRLAEQQDRKDQLQREKDLGNIDQEQLDRALEQLEQEGEELQDLQDLAKLLEDCKDCMGKGDRSAAAKKLKAIAARLKEFDLDEDELKELAENQKLLEECQGMICQRLGKQAGGPPGGRRPMGKEEQTKAHDARQKGDTDPNGKLRVTGFSRGGTFSKVPAREVEGTFRQAVQDAPEAIERQRITPEAAEMLKGYYENLGGQKKN